MLDFYFELIFGRKMIKILLLLFIFYDIYIVFELDDLC